MTGSQKIYYQRFSEFAVDCAKLISGFDWKVSGNQEWGRQLVRSSGSVGANFIEAIEASSDADFIYRYCVCRKEANESIHWLYLLMRINGNNHRQEIKRLIQEAREFVRIFTASIETKRKNIKN